MARVVGGPARYVTKESIKKYQLQFFTIFFVAYFVALILGFFLGFNFQRYPYVQIASLIFVVVAAIVARSVINKIIDTLEKKRVDFRKEGAGEAVVCYILESLPDDYVLIHGLKPKSRYGDIDHVVVGPSGVYAIDTKNWRGVVAADGKGELLLNGKPTKKPEVKNLTRTVLSIREEIKVLFELNLHIRGILAFPAARVEARWGSTGHVHCVTDGKLYEYIAEKKKEKKLSKKEVESISQTLLSLARMDKDRAPDGK
jgi:diacylglycerol kinase